jgi:hypothetical protein
LKITLLAAAQGMFASRKRTRFTQTRFYTAKVRLRIDVSGRTGGSSVMLYDHFPQSSIGFFPA